MKNTVFAIATAAIILPTAALASEHNKNEMTLNYSGPVETVSVADLLSDTSMFTEKETIVEGHLIKQINADTFIFSDGTKEIQVEIDDDINMPAAINATTRLRLYGEYEGGNTPEIEVDRIQLL
ncbi:MULTISPECIES: YgiW/YdeI family stress tolerance OB fold protein [Photobacterium]|uniref:YgiW/YdeI family stress tolerance OB fold protein n=1 Tax=Photobacterium TaxID=657 RepID=UPI0005CBDEE0|nr:MULTISPECIES: NirD/YgiW/YdeI family stress tolerance protein [Photobacterium]WEM45895.1 NirD/YgiW/YdeI family stress tolerance protein [Photobacterium sp. DA100]